MRLKLTQQQCNALYLLFQCHIIPIKPVDMAESLVLDLMTCIYKKLRNKVEAPRPKKDGFSITLSETEAKAYFVYFNQRYLGESFRYESNFINQHINIIDKQYA